VALPMRIREAYHRWRENYRVFRFYFRKYRKFYLFGLFALVIVDVLEAVPPLLLKTAVDGLMEKPYGPELRSLLLQVVLAYMAVAILQGYMRYLWRKFIIRTSMYASHDMRTDLFNHLSTMSPGFFQKKRVGDLVSLSTNDIEAVRFALGPGALLFFDCLFYFLVIPPIMIWISPELAVLSFLPLLIVPIFVRKMEGFIQKRFREVQDRFADLASHCQEALGGIRVVKGSALESFKDREFEMQGERYRKAGVRSAVTQATLTTGLETILSVATTLLFLVGGAFVIGEKISVGVFVAFQRYIQKMSWPMEGLGLAANIFQRSIASQKRVDEVLLREAGVIDPPRPKKISHAGVPAVQVNKLTFTYPGASRPALENVSLEIPAGRRVGIAGGVGSGKSTLLACLARMLSVPSGTVFFEGTDVTELPFGEVRRRIAFVPQENFLFSRSIEDNVLYGSREFTEALVAARTAAAVRAGKLAAVDADIQRLPRAYSSILGERGANLSGGQRQRLTIARAIARGPQVMLLDDCMSAIDAETERRLLSGIFQASKGISLLLASHRVSSFRHLDWIVVMEEGRIAAQGTPEQLIRSNSTLVELARREQLETMDLLQ
jgi:ATP-binding cassette, subfamily B, multidrug efflux pump